VYPSLGSLVPGPPPAVEGGSCWALLGGRALLLEGRTLLALQQGSRWVVEGSVLVSGVAPWLPGGVEGGRGWPAAAAGVVVRGGALMMMMGWHLGCTQGSHLVL